VERYLKEREVRETFAEWNYERHARAKALLIKLRNTSKHNTKQTQGVEPLSKKKEKRLRRVHRKGKEAMLQTIGRATDPILTIQGRRKALERAGARDILGELWPLIYWWWILLLVDAFKYFRGTHKRVYLGTIYNGDWSYLYPNTKNSPCVPITKKVVVTGALVTWVFMTMDNPTELTWDFLVWASKMTANVAACATVARVLGIKGTTFMTLLATARHSHAITPYD
jgi:hypothetical protein